MPDKLTMLLVDVIPVSDPNSSTMAQRVVQYQAVLQMAQSAPQIYDLPASTQADDRGSRGKERR